MTDGDKKVYDDMGKQQWGEEEWEEHRGRQRRAQQFADDRKKREDHKQKEFASMLGQVRSFLILWDSPCIVGQPIALF